MLSVLMTLLKILLVGALTLLYVGTKYMENALMTLLKKFLDYLQPRDDLPPAPPLAFQPPSSSSRRILHPRTWRNIMLNDLNPLGNNVGGFAYSPRDRELKVASDDKSKEGEYFYNSGDFQSSIRSYTEAIKIYNSASTGSLLSDTLAQLLLARADGLLKIGAFVAAVEDCKQALKNFTTPRAEDPFWQIDFILRCQLHTCLARGYLKLGNHLEAHKAFSDSIATAKEASAFSGANTSLFVHREVNYAELGQDETDCLIEIWNTINSFDSNLSDPSKFAELLTLVNSALTIAPGSLDLNEFKVTLLGKMKRWREAAGYLERLAALNVRMDGVFVADLASQNPFPGVLPAQSLQVGFFEGKRDEDAATQALTLTKEACAEVVLRLPYELTQTYIRALRLEERYDCADACLLALGILGERLDEMQRMRYLNTIFKYHQQESSKLERTRQGQEKAKEFFHGNFFEHAQHEYAACLKIDAEGVAYAPDAATAGGRLHAVLHYNRAICLIMLGLDSQAAEEFTLALKIHPRWMQAILIRARCYSNLQGKAKDAIADYSRWLELAKDTEESGVPLAPCLLGGPKTITRIDWSEAQKELDVIVKAERLRRAETTARAEARRRAGGHPESVQFADGADHYAVLGLERSALVFEIRQSYRRLAREYHLDKNKEEGAKDKMCRINLAYETLNDPGEKRQYDAQLVWGI